MKESEKLLDELYTLLLHYRKEAKAVNLGAATKDGVKKRDFYNNYLDSEVLEIENYRGYSIKVWVNKIK